MSDSRIHFLNLDFADYPRLSIFAGLLVEVGVELVKHGSTALLTRATFRTIVFKLAPTPAFSGPSTELLKRFRINA